MEQQHIDHLLERHLSLLDEYSRLRQQLSKLQAGVYQNIARANFAGERGMRYGQDHYDDRMRALRVLDVQVAESQVPGFTVKNAEEAADQQRGNSDNDDDDDDDDDDDGNNSAREKEKDATGDERQPTMTTERRKKKKKKKKKQQNKNPLHWFGLFAPSALRTAQAQSVEAVERVIPRLASVSAEMANIELEVRRARKRRAKAMLAAEKKGAAVSDGASAADATATSLPVEAR